MRREEKKEKKEERREERRQDDPGPKFPDWCRAWGVTIFAMYASRVRIWVRGSYQVSGRGLGLWALGHLKDKEPRTQIVIGFAP